MFVRVGDFIGNVMREKKPPRASGHRRECLLPRIEYVIAIPLDLTQCGGTRRIEARDDDSWKGGGGMTTFSSIHN